MGEEGKRRGRRTEDRLGRRLGKEEKEEEMRIVWEVRRIEEERRTEDRNGRLGRGILEEEKMGKGKGR